VSSDRAQYEEITGKRDLVADGGQLAERLAELLIAHWRRMQPTNTNARPSANQPGASEHGVQPCSISSP